MSEHPIQTLLSIMEALRDPETGCPWDIEQDFKSIAQYTLEETYEVIDAIENDDMNNLKEELGDLLLQVVFHSQMASEQKIFDFDDVVKTVSDKMISRHPHVFAETDAKTPDDVNVIWENQKDMEKQNDKNRFSSILDDVPLALPAVQRSQKIQKRAAKVGFEWPEASQVLDKLEEETQEMREALKNNQQNEIEDELGDLFFVLINFARMLDLDAETTIRKANQKFERRFRGVEQDAISINTSLKNLSLNEMETLWQEQKQKEKAY